MFGRSNWIIDGCCKNSNIFVCYDLTNERLIPLSFAKYSSKILPGLCIVQLELKYSTDKQNEPMDLEYVFSINENAAVTKMIVKLDKTKVYGIVKEKEEAKQEYEKGLKQGKTMAYSESDPKYPQIKRVKVGQLAPKKKLKITFEYIQPLEVFLNKFWKFELFPIFDQNYVQENKAQMIGIYDEQIYEYLDGLFRIKDFQFTFKQEIQVEIDFGSPITFWKSPTHKLESTNAKNNAKVNNQHLVLLLEDIPNNYDPSKQFTLLFSSDEINLPRAILSHTKNDALQYQKYCATLTFIPKFNEVSLDDAYSQYLDGLIIADNQKIKRGNYLFIIDRSGSMSGSRIKKAKEALILFLKSLPQDSEYNIISFGTNFTKLWNVSQNYSQNTLETAIKHVEEMDADMGGTCIIAPLKQMIYHKNYGASKNTTLNVFLLTDGQDTADPIIDLVQKNNLAQTRIYTLGIGRECSQYLIRRVAEVGNGKYQIVSDKEDINEKVIDLLEDSLTPYLEAFTLESNIPNITSIIPNPDSIVSLKKNQELTFQILFPNQQKPEVLEFKIRCYDPQNNQQISYSVKLNLNESQDNEYFHKLAAYKFITYYENSIKYGQNNVNFIKLNKNKIDSQDIIALSVQNQILCSRTAFICEVCDLEDQFQQQIKQRVSVVQPKQARQPAQLYACSGYQSRCNIQLQQASSQYKSSGCCSTGGSSKSYSNFNTSPSPQKYALQTQPLKKQTDQSIDKSDSDKFTYETLIQFAQANGCFIINKEVKSKINFKNLQNHQNLKDDVWFTFLVLLYLENYFSQYKKSWQLVYQKGISYLKQNGMDYKAKKNEYKL
ncbi:unnamed protein product (macronuclear) [Paramecium tetraurelia]|uniref:VWFA domain-containing protein n=1 Tax=Paramecium tetraurelia TaxID=5888 RepID=A0D130_PARTE|nr:uncharacterized protein GSPATT00039162001 [Paramecium tetraurelia]CAK76747.1 unnamed protein product [Paramecium tetraurelia]|eukprot:XP_001444144.1 hypothetical protein (macronuclear) [Paramecium tetraurelia strain d4-2]